MNRVNIAIALIASVAFLGTRGIHAQNTERIYKRGDRAGDSVVQGPTKIHAGGQSIGPLRCGSRSKLRSVRSSVGILIGTDGNVRDVSFTKMEAWIAEGDGKTLIDDSDPRWKDYTTVFEAYKKVLSMFFSQDRTARLRSTENL
jgi:hypothetical protein